MSIDWAWPGVGVALVVCLRVTEAHDKPPKVEKVSRKNRLRILAKCLDWPNYYMAKFFFGFIPVAKVEYPLPN